MHEYYFDAEAIAGSAMGVFFAIYVIVVLIALAVGAVSYVLQSLSLYAIANRRGIKKPWLAWVPVLKYWTLGCISDQYRYVTRGEVKNKRIALLVLNIVTLALEIGIWVINIAMMISYGGAVSDSAAAVAGWMAFSYVIGGVAVFGVSIATLVIWFIALYDLYRSCDPNNAVAYLLLTIFVNWLTPVFLMIVRKKDEGMPPRKADVAAAAPQIPAQPPESPAEEPWQQSAEEAEPWKNPEE
jgi:hypothetical protein